MVFRYVLTVLPTNTQDNPASAEMWVELGLITGLDILFPPGCAAYVHTHICVLETQMWPKSGSTDFALDNYTIEIRNEEVAIATQPALLKAYAWSEDTRFEHTLTYRIFMTKGYPHTLGGWLRRAATQRTGRLS